MSTPTRPTPTRPTLAKRSSGSLRLRARKLPELRAPSEASEASAPSEASETQAKPVETGFASFAARTLSSLNLLDIARNQARQAWLESIGETDEPRRIPWVAASAEIPHVGLAGLGQTEERANIGDVKELGPAQAQAQAQAQLEAKPELELGLGLVTLNTIAHDALGLGLGQAKPGASARQSLGASASLEVYGHQVFCPYSGLTRVYLDNLPRLDERTLEAVHPLYWNNAKLARQYRDLIKRNDTSVPLTVIAGDILYAATYSSKALTHTTGEWLALANQELIKCGRAMLTALWITLYVDGGIAGLRSGSRHMSASEALALLAREREESLLAYERQNGYGKLAGLLVDMLYSAKLTTIRSQHDSHFPDAGPRLAQAKPGKACQAKPVEAKLASASVEMSASDRLAVAAAMQSDKLARMVAIIPTSDALAKRKEWTNIIRPKGKEALAAWADINSALGQSLKLLNADDMQELIGGLQEKYNQASAPSAKLASAASAARASSSSTIIGWGHVSVQAKARYKAVLRALQGIYQAKLDESLGAWCSEADLLEAAKGPRPKRSPGKACRSLSQAEPGLLDGPTAPELLDW